MQEAQDAMTSTEFVQWLRFLALEAQGFPATPDPDEEALAFTPVPSPTQALWQKQLLAAFGVDKSEVISG